MVDQTNYPPAIRQCQTALIGFAQWNYSLSTDLFPQFYNFSPTQPCFLLYGSVIHFHGDHVLSHFLNFSPAHYLLTLSAPLLSSHLAEFICDCFHISPPI